MSISCPATASVRHDAITAKSTSARATMSPPGPPARRAIAAGAFSVVGVGTRCIAHAIGTMSRRPPHT